MARKKKPQNMTSEELEAELITRSNERAALREHQLEVSAILDAKRAKEKAQGLAEGLSDSERTALFQALAPEGIDTEELA